MSSQDHDQDTRVVAVVLISAILLAIGLAVGTGVQTSRSGADQSAPATPAAQAPAPAADASAAPAVEATVAAPVGAAAAAAADDASIVVENGVVKFYFASGKADLAPGAAEALTDAIDAAKGGRKLVISGFHDATGNAATNAELARQRAVAVRNALVAAGVDAAQIELKKPEESTGSGNAAEARRVEVLIAD